MPDEAIRTPMPPMSKSLIDQVIKEAQQCLDKAEAECAGSDAAMCELIDCIQSVINIIHSLNEKTIDGK